MHDYLYAVRSIFSSGSLAPGKGVQLSVPLRCDEQGRMVIGAITSIDYPVAPCAGSGEVLLQARSKDAIIEIGPNVAFSNNISIIANQQITIGRDCLIRDFAPIMDSDFHAVDPLERRRSAGLSVRR